MSSAYLYGIVESTREAALGIPGADGISPVRILATSGLGCVVSDYCGSEFRAMPKEELLKPLIAHQRVIERVMEQHTVLPMKFGTILASTEEVLQAASQCRSHLSRALASIRDKVEMEVAVTWDIKRVLQRISHEEEVVRIREAITLNGRPTLEDQVKLGQVAKACMDRRRESYRERMVGLLRPFCVATARNHLVSDEMVMNVAFLIERAREQEFDERVRELDLLFQNEITFRVLGPLPPYSFNTAVLKRLDMEQVEGAKRALHLQDALSEAEIRKAYRRLAAWQQSHTSLGDGLANAGLRALREASQLLLSYCRAQNGAQEGEAPVGPEEVSARGLFLVTVLRAGSDEVEPARFGGAKRA